MAELTFKSAGVSTREIDLSGPTPTGPQGVPAGIIGTSLKGPAYVPITFATFAEFVSIFGEADGAKFGPIAVNEWLKNARACTYIRVLGIGDGKQRNSSSGVVTNAGFVVGDRIPQDNGLMGNNTFGNTAVSGETKGRTYFLGCFMSESNGSSIFSDAGIQPHATQATTTLTIGHTAASTGLLADNNIVTIFDANGMSGSFEFLDETTSVSSTTNVAVQMGTGINVSTRTGTQLATLLETAIDASKVDVDVSRTNNVLTLTQRTPGSTGNVSIIESLAEITQSAFTGGAGGAVPILRGVLLAPSGVILHLSGNRHGDTAAPVVSETAKASSATLMGRKGGLFGSVKMDSQEFVLLMNGYKGSAERPTHITASLDMTAPNYFANVLNRDPLKIEEKGHLLYGHYDVYPTLASVTGSGAVRSRNALRQDVAFLLTSSVGREATSFGNVPVYEDFQDRFSAAETPFIISQEFDRPIDLFKVVALNDGAGESTKLKISVENLARSTSDTNKFGKFDLVVRRFDDSDDEKKVLESFRGLSLDPGSPRYIARAIGDQNVFFNFDSDAESQKIVVDGTHPVISRYVRVELSDAMKKKEVPEEALPFGFRGPRHLVTSGTMLASAALNTAGVSGSSHAFFHSDIMQRVVEPPVPYRENVAVGTGLNKRADSRFYWGMQTTRKVSITEPNKPGLVDDSWRTFNKFFPKHRKDTTAFSVGGNPGASDVNGSVLDCDRFNNNQFSLEKLKIRTGSDGVADAEQWVSASFVRRGNITADAAAKTRKFRVSDLDRAGNRKYLKFTVPLQGGFDGTNIFDAEKSKLSNVAAKREMDDETAQGGTAGPTVSAYRKAVDVMGSKSDVEIQLLAIPGIRHTSVSDFAISAVEGRFDALYIMDIEERDQTNTVITSSAQNPHVAHTVSDFKNRSLDTSFAAAYFPDVTVRDPSTSALVQVPPSVAVLGAYALNDRIGHPWFAPAGFTRGGLDAVETTAVKLNRTNLDDLYDSDINPISAFPGTGITVWGQKTCLQASSALDRVNVRRLLISVRRSVRNIANSLLFEPNRAETLEKFSALVNPVLQRVQELSGVDRYKVIIDTTTTTQADVENNTIRGKIFLQPTRAVEFVALDFVVTNAGSELL